MGRNKVITVERVKIATDIPKDVYAAFRAALVRRGRSGAFVFARLAEFYTQLDDAEEVEFIAKFSTKPETTGGGR